MCYHCTTATPPGNQICTEATTQKGITKAQTLNSNHSYEVIIENRSIGHVMRRADKIGVATKALRLKGLITSTQGKKIATKLSNVQKYFQQGTMIDVIMV